MISLLADALASQTLSFNHYLSGMIHLPLLFPSCPTSSSSYVCYFLFIIHFHTIHNSCFGICVQLRVRGGFHAAFRLAHATLCIMCPRLSGMMSQKEEMWRKQEKGGFGGEEWVMSVLIKWANLQSCGIHEETGHPGGGRDCWKRGWKTRLKDSLTSWEIPSFTFLLRAWWGDQDKSHISVLDI